MKLMDIDSDTLGIPDTEYDARVTMLASEFTRIVRDLSLLGESVRIEVSKEGVRFASEGEAANGNVLLRQTEGTGIGKVTQPKPKEKKPKKEDGAEGDEVINVDDNEEEEEDGEKKKTKAKKVKKEPNGDVDMDDEEEFNAKSDDDGEDEQDKDDNDDEESGKKRKKKASSSSKPAKKAKTAPKGKGKKKADSGDEDSDDDNFEGVRIEMNSHVSLTFSLKYLVNFSKSATLCKKVQLMMSNDVPLLVSALRASDLPTHPVSRYPMILVRAT